MVSTIEELWFDFRKKKKNVLSLEDVRPTAVPTWTAVGSIAIYPRRKANGM
jgi:hypothetical protein